MKSILRIVILIILFASKICAQTVINVAFNARLEQVGDSRYIVSDIYLTPASNVRIEQLDIYTDVDRNFFAYEPTDDENVFSFKTIDKEWSDPYYIFRQANNLYYNAPNVYMAINRTLYDSYIDLIDECRDENPNCPLYLKKNIRYHYGVFRWKLLSTAKGVLKIRIREDEVFSGDNASGVAPNNYKLVFVNYDGTEIERDAGGSALVVINTTPFEEVAVPENLAGDTLVCGTPKTLAYTVTRPNGVDSCAWFISSDEAGANPVSGVASIELTEKGAKAKITWNKITTGEKYYIQVKSVKETKESDPIHLKVRVEDFPNFAGSVKETINCRSTELSWTPPTGMTMEMYLFDYSGGKKSSPYTSTVDTTYHFVRYWSAQGCKDTVNFKPAFLDPKIQWMAPLPPATVARDEQISADVNYPTGIPAKYTPTKDPEYIWVKPTTQPLDYTRYYVSQAVASRYVFEVYAEVDNCKSNTLTDTTDVSGGGIRPKLTTASGQLIACQNGGVMLKSDPDGGSGNYTFKWYSGKAAGTSIGETKSVWVTPTADTKYFVEVTDETSGEKVVDSIAIVYKNMASPVVSAGNDQRIIEGTYTHLLGTVTDGASTDYVWNWSPADKLTSGNMQYTQTIALTEQQKYALYVVDGNGCMSKPDSVLVDPNQKPEGSDPFKLAVTPEEVTLCKNNSVQFDIAASGINLEGATYLWTPATGLDDKNIRRPVLTASDGISSGNYFVEISKGDLRIVRKATVTINTKEEAPRLQLAENRMKCTGDVIEIEVTGTEPDKYVWMLDGQVIADQTGKSYTLAETGTHTVKVYGKNTGATCASDTLTVSDTIGAGVTLTGVKQDVKVCGNQTAISFESIAPAASAFKWLASDDSELSTTEKSITVNKSGEYRLISGSGACTDTTRIRVTLGNVLKVHGLRPVITGCSSTAELAFDSTTAPSYVWLNMAGEEIAGSKDKNPFTVSSAGIYRLKLDGGDCRDTSSVKVLLNTPPVVNDVKDEITTCSNELALSGSASEGTLYWSENKAGTPVVTKLTGTSGKTKSYYVYADAGAGCKSEPKEVKVSFGTKPKVLVDELQTTCGVPYTLQASSTGTGGVKWYDTQTAVTPILENIEQIPGQSREYWVSADDGSGCASERKKVLVKFGVSPELTVSTLQTTCATTLELKASTTGGRLVWKEVGATQELLLTKVSGNTGDIKYYNVYVEDGSCPSATKKVEVRFGVNPEVLADNLYTTCGTQFTLQGGTSAGTLGWYSDSQCKIALSSLTVNKGSTAVTTYYAQAVEGSCTSTVKEVRVAFESKPYIEVSTPQTSCASNATVVLQAKTTGGNMVWENADGAKLASATVNQSGMYYVYAEDGICRSTKESVEVKFGVNPIVVAEAKQTTCGKEYDLKATASGGVLKWYTEDGTEITTTRVTGASATSKKYRVKAVDGSCSSNEEIVTVSFGMPPTVTVTDINSCEEVVKLVASTTGGSLSWKKKGSSDILPIPQVTGVAGTSETYTVQAQDGTCKNTKDVKVTFGSKPKLNIPSLLTACGGTCTLPSSEGDVTLNWLREDKTTGVTNLDLTGTKGTSSKYWAYADVAGCRSDLIEVTVAFGELPKVEVVSPQTTCETSLTLSAVASGGTLRWKKSDGSELTNLLVSGKSGQTDTYYVMAEDGSCKGAEESVEVHFGEKPQVIVEQEITTCEEEYTLTAVSTDPQATIHWVEADKTTPVTVARGASGSSKTYYVYASATGCGAGEMTKVTVHFGTLPMLNVSPITSCDTIVQLVAQSSVKNLVWTDGKGKELASTQVHGKAGTSGVYYVQAKDGKCTSEREAVQVSFGTAPELLVEEIQTVCASEEYELQAQATGKANIVWYQSDGVTPLTSTVVRKVGSGTAVYYVEAQGGTSCTSPKQKVTVLFDHAPVLTLDKEVQTTCGTSLTLQASASAGEVVWTKPDGTKLALPLVSGTKGEVQQYYVYAQDGSCESVKKTVEVRFGTTPMVEVAAVQTACGESHTLEATASDGILHWLDADGTTELKNTTVTGAKGSQKKYYVYAENGQTCQSDRTAVTVMFGTSPMIVDVLTPQTTCGTSLQLTATATAGEVVWRDALGVSLVTPLITQTTPGEYTYYAQAKDGTCSGASQAVQVKFGTRPQVVCEARQTTCSTTSYTIEASATEGILHYLASDKRTALPSATVTAAGTYHVYAQAPGCFSDTVAVEVQFGTKPVVTVVNPQTTCEDILHLEATTTGGELFWEKLTDGGLEPLLLSQITAGDGIATCYVYAAGNRDDEACRSEKEMVNITFGDKPQVAVESQFTTCGETLALPTDNGLSWLEGDGVTPLASTTVTAKKDTVISYWVYAQKEECSSDKQKVTVAFGVPPIVTVPDTLTSCGTNMTLSATTSAGTLYWLDKTKKSVANTTFNNISAQAQEYYVYAQDGSCKSAEHKVTALFKTNPLVLADELQTSCNPDVYELKATASAGTLHWMNSDKTPLASTVIKGRKGESLEYIVYAEEKTCRSKDYRITVKFGVDPMLEVFTPQTVCGSGEVVVGLNASVSGGQPVWTDENGKPLATTQQKATAPTTKYYYVHAEDGTCKSVTEKVEVRFGGRPVVEAEKLQTACGTSLTLQGKVSNGVAKWTTSKGVPLTSLTVIPAQGDTYRLSADDGDCSSDGYVEVKVLFNTVPVVNVVTPQTTCGDQIRLEATATGGELVWLNANGEQMNLTQVSAPKGTKATYYVYAKGTNCESPKELVEVEFGAKPKVLVEEIQTACGTSHVLTATVTDGEAVWLDAAKKPLSSTTVTGTAGEAKDYYVYAKAATCESEQQKVTVHFGKSPIVQTTALQTTCENTLTLQASATAGVVVWKTETGDVLPTPIVTGTAGGHAYYYVIAKDGSCESSAERVEVRFGAKPEVLLASDVFTTCGNEYTLEAQATSGQVNWYASKESTLHLASATVTKPASANSAEYYVQAQHGECIGDRQKVTVVFGSNPVVTPTTPLTTCGTNVVLSATATGGDLVWKDDKDQTLTYPVATGTKGKSATYYVQAKDGSCTSEVKTVFVNFGVAPVVQTETKQTVCGTSVDLQAVATGGSVYWLDGSKQSLPTTRAEGTRGETKHYYVYAKDNTCASDTVAVDVSFGTGPQLDVTAAQTSCGNVVELQAQTSGGELKWTLEDGTSILPAIVRKPTSGDNLTCYVQAVDGDCSSERKQVSVKFGTSPEVFVEPLQTSCDTVYTLTASVSAGEVVWEDESRNRLTSTSVHGKGIKTYYVYANAGKTCSSEKIKVKVAFGTDPVINVENRQTTCSTTGLELKATASAGTPIWEKEDGTKLTQTTVTPDMGKVYRVYAQDGKCKGKVETVTIDFGVVPEITVEPLQVTCGTELELKATTSAGELHWINESNAPISVKLTSAGGSTQRVFVYAQDGTCTADAKSVEVKFDQRPELHDLQYKPVACASPYRLEAASTGGTIIWQTAAGKEIVDKWVDLVDGENIFFVRVEDQSCLPVTSGSEKVTVTLGGKPQLTLTTVQCAGDTIYADEANSEEGLTYRWFVDGALQAGFTGRGFLFTEGGTHKLQAVAEKAGGCVSDTATAVYQIAEPLRIAWDTKPAASINVGNNIRGCVKVASGEAAGIEWHWTSPTTPAITGTCANISAKEEEYNFEVYATNDKGCASDTLRTGTTVSGFGELVLELESSAGNVFCKGGSVLLTALVSGGTPPYTYRWYVKGETTPIQEVTGTAAVNVLATAPTADITYVVKVRDAQASAPAIGSKEIALTMKEATIPVANAGDDMTIRRNMQTLLKGVGGADIKAWEWLPVEKLAAPEESSKQYPQTAVLSTSQKYKLYVTNTEGCISNPDEMVVFVLPLDGTEIGIPTPPVSEGLNLTVQPVTDTLCLGAERWIVVKDVLKGLSSSATYTWVSSPDVTLTWNAKRDSALFVPTAAGDYTFSIFVEDGNKKMALRSSIRVNDSKAPRYDLAVTGNCQNDTVKMVYEAGSVQATQWEWKVKGNAVTNTGDYYVLSNAGTYKVEVKAGNKGCAMVQKATEVTVGAAPEISGLAMTDSCGRAVIEVTATGATAGYTWTATPSGAVMDGADNRYVIANTGKYKVTVSASNGTCSAVRSLEGEVYSRPQLKDWVTAPADAVSSGDPIMAAVAVQTGGKADYVYHWLQPDDAKTTTTGSYTLTNATLANYTFEVYASDANACVSDTLKKKVSVDGGKIELEIVSVYGKEICQGGAAMLVARAKGAELPVLFDWTKEGVTARSAKQNSEYDTLWVEANKAGDYQVTVKKDAGSRILASGEIKGLTVSGTHTAPTLTVGGTLTVPQGKQTVLLAEAKGGTPAYKWHWTPAEHLAVAADTAVQYPMTAALSGRQEYWVYVTDANSCAAMKQKIIVDVDENNGLCVAINPKNAEICRGNTVPMTAEVSCNKPTEWKLEYSWLPADRSDLLDVTDKDSVVFTPKTNGEYTWIVKVTSGTMVAAARAVVTVKDANAPRLTLGGRQDCVNDTMILTNAGEAAAKYVWLVDGLEVAETSERFVLADTAVKSVKVYAVADNGCLSDTISAGMKLGIVPEVKIADGAFVNYPDSVNVLKVVQVDGLTDEQYQFAWTSAPENKFNGATDGLSAVTVPMAGDVKYTLTVTNKANTVCQATDTAWGYIIPAKVPVKIDKDENTGALHLAWSKDSLGMADSVRVMGIKWDGYAVKSSYQPRAMAQGVAERYVIDASKDTMEYFYINASRYIPEMGRSYYSHSSDTVGYMRQWLYRNANLANGYEFNYIAYPFDMSDKEIKTMRDFAKYIGRNSSGKYSIYTVSSYISNIWKNVTVLAGSVFETSGTNMPLTPGGVYRVVLRNNETTNFILYGRLPDKFSYRLEGEDKYNFVLVPLSFAHTTDRKEVGKVVNNIYTIATYKYSEQMWRSTTRITGKNGVDEWSGTIGDYNISVWRAIRMDLKKGTNSYDWKK